PQDNRCQKNAPRDAPPAEEKRDQAIRKASPGRRSPGFNRNRFRFPAQGQKQQGDAVFKVNLLAALHGFLPVWRFRECMRAVFDLQGFTRLKFTRIIGLVAQTLGDGCLTRWQAAKGSRSDSQCLPIFQSSLSSCGMRSSIKPVVRSGIWPWKSP